MPEQWLETMISSPTAAHTFPAPIETEQDVKVHLDALLLSDPRLVQIYEECGHVPLRILGQGYAGLTQIIVGQLLSVAAAKAIHTRLVTRLGEVTPHNMMARSDDDLRALGLSFAKINCLKSIAEAMETGAFDLFALAELESEAALKQLLSLKGVGRWTAEIYLISGLGHPDYFPAGDLVLRKMVQKVIEAVEMPSEKEVREIVKAWSPHRAVAARLLWRYFAVLRDREGINL